MNATLLIITLVAAILSGGCSSSSTFSQNKKDGNAQSDGETASDAAPVGFKPSGVKVSDADGKTQATGAAGAVEPDPGFSKANEPIPVTAINLTDYQVNVWQITPAQLEQGGIDGVIQASLVTSAAVAQDGSFQASFASVGANQIVLETSTRGQASQLRLLRRSEVGIPHTLIWYPEKADVLHPLYRKEAGATGEIVTVAADGSIEVLDATNKPLPPNSNLMLDAGAYQWKDGTQSATCRAYMEDSRYQDEGNANYWINPDGKGPRQSVSCDMAGGGFTIVTSLNFIKTYDASFAAEEKIQVNGDGFTGLKLVKCSGALTHLYSDDCSNGAPSVALAIGSRSDLSVPTLAKRMNLTSAVGSEPNFEGGGNTYAGNKEFFQWYFVGPTSTLGTNKMIDTVTCGSAGDSCYESVVATAAGRALTPSGKNLVYSANDSGFKLWVESDGNKILRANGLDEWQMALNPSGKGFSSNYLTDKLVLSGRVCPPNVYLDDSNKFATGGCLYYDNGHPTQTLNANGNDGIDGLENHAVATGVKWYEGNIQTCNAQGMRLPTIYETNTAFTTSYSYPTKDGTPVFAETKGVPATGLMWTATGGGLVEPDGCDPGKICYLLATVYAIWGHTSVAFNDTVGNPGSGVRCVLP